MKTIWKIGLFIAALIAVLLFYTFSFNKGGAIESGINAIGGTFNSTWQKITGGNDKFVPEYKGEDNTGLDDAGSGW